MNKVRKKSFWQTNYWIIIVVVVTLSGWAIRQPIIQDFWLGLGYEPNEKTAEIQDELELTSRGKRIFAATQPTVEANVEFNEHCNSHDVDISLLGCYTDGKIYVYDITLEQIEAANKVTMAHELLHAVWERMYEWEKDDIVELLEKVYAENKEWFSEELEPYRESEWIEEMYTRAGTKLEDLPEELEKHYAKIFQNRQKIVEYYKTYEAPFVALQEEIEELEKRINEVGDEIERERKTYLMRIDTLDMEIDSFNRCADIAGCFRSEAEFSRKRNALLAEREALEQMRGELNAKITENNKRIEEYREKQGALGELSDAMNSNVELIKEREL